MTDAIKLRETKIEADLAEKNILLKEIHHRVKNNLQLVTSMLNLQESYLYDARDAESFEKTRLRIKSIAMVHEKLYKSDDMSNINITEYIRDLVYEMVSIPENRIAVDVTGEPVLLPLSKALPCVLIILELVSNALKHAFPENAAGYVHIGVEETDTGEISILIADTGTGFIRDKQAGSQKGLGLILVENLLRQLQAECTTTTDGGTQYCIRFLR